MRVHPRHRGDCADFYATPQQPARIAFDGPDASISELEQAAARAGRTWSEQFIYVTDVCREKQRPDFDDERSVEDWRTLLSPCRLRFHEGEDWCPCPCLWWGTTRNRSRVEA